MVRAASRQALPGAKTKHMAIYHFSIQPIQRSAGRSAAAAAAYRAGCVVVDGRTGEVHDYTRKGGVLSARLILPGGGTTDRSAFWSRVEAHHKHPRAVTAREIVLALPKELSATQRRELAEQYALDLADRYGVAVDVCLHGPDEDNGNWHAHLLISACACSPTGELGTKVLALDPISATMKKTDRVTAVAVERPRWEALANEALERAGRAERIDHRTLRAQGIDRAPQVHLGPSATEVERRTGEKSRRRLYGEALAAKAVHAVAEVAAEISDTIDSIEAALRDAYAERAGQLAAAAAAVTAAAASVVAPMPAAAAPAAPHQEARQGVPEAEAVPAPAPIADRVLQARLRAEAAVRQLAQRRQDDRPAPAPEPVTPVNQVDQAEPVAVDRLDRLRARHDRARQAADQAAKAAEPWHRADDAAQAARRQLAELATERAERVEAISGRRWIERAAALLGDPDKGRIAEIDAATQKAKVALQRAEQRMDKAEPLRAAMERADGSLSAASAAVKTAEAAAAKAARLEAERQRLAEWREQPPAERDDDAQRDG